MYMYLTNMYYFFALLGAELLPQGHEGRYMCSPQQEGVQRAPGFPAGQ